MRTIIAIVGPTGSGKTELGVKIARKNDGAVVSCDARQIYRFMDIGTAKPDIRVRDDVPHYMIDIVNPDERYTAYDYARDARKVIEKLENPIIVGGSGLYLRALADGLFSLPKIDPEVRKRLSLRDTDDLLEELKKVDTETAKKLHPNDRLRIIRAVEVYEATGTPISSLRRKKEPARFRVRYMGVNIVRERLLTRIDDRVEQMIKSGLVEEVRSLLLRFGDVPPLFSIGYKEIIFYLRDEISLKRAVDLIKRNTKNYAKRQLTWFRKVEDIEWVDPLLSF